jgi:hypothetical protein
LMSLGRECLVYTAHMREDILYLMSLAPTQGVRLGAHSSLYWRKCKPKRLSDGSWSHVLSARNRT